MIRWNPDYLPAVGLGLTQIVGYGTLMYAYAVLLPHMARDLGLSLSMAFGILSLGLFFGGAVAPLSGMLVDRFGGRWVMTIGSALAGLAVMSLSLVTTVYGLFAAILCAEAAGMLVLYNVAFASVARLDLRLPAQKSIFSDHVVWRGCIDHLLAICTVAFQLAGLADNLGHPGGNAADHLRPAARNLPVTPAERPR